MLDDDLPKNRRNVGSMVEGTVISVVSSDTPSHEKACARPLASTYPAYPHGILVFNKASGCHEGIPPNLKDLVMTPKFLREEAARFRGMAETVDRDASKLRFLTMATDFEERAKAADDLTEPTPDEALKVKVAKKIAKQMEDGV